MNKLKQFYINAGSDGFPGLEEAARRKAAYAEYKKDYIARCKKERTERYSFWQRNKIYIGAVCFSAVMLSAGSLYFAGSKGTESEYVLNEITDTTNAVVDEVPENVSAAGEKNRIEEPTVETDPVISTDEQPSVPEDIKVGMEVNFVGDIHYESSYSTALPVRCSGGKAIVTRINEQEAHPYHLESCDASCTVYGWVDAENIELPAP